MKTPLSIYIHWPFCKAKCPYCDFNSHVREGVDHARWRAALLRELQYYVNKLPGCEIASIFFGGGTPSLMQSQTAAALIDAAGKHWSFAPDVEITLEANPTSIEAQKFREFRDAGINRVSVGIQSLRQNDLQFLGRQHTVTEALAAFALARNTFDRASFDLIYARPGQTLAAWEEELKEALGHAGDHLSLYQLTIEENTAFYTAQRKGAFVMPEDALSADMYDLTQSIMEAHGMPAYEVSNHAKAGQESRHNIAYWKSHDVVGIGPGAHGRYSIYNKGNASPSSLREFIPAGSSQELLHASNVKRFATETIKSPERWLDKVEQSGTGLIVETELSAREQLEERVMMGLRLAEGIKNEAGLSAAVIERLKGQGLLEPGERIQATAQGRLLLNGITQQLLVTD